ncbi:MAG: translation elongation factor Ts [bacterium]
MIDAKMVAEFRESSGAGMMDAKRALEEAGGDKEKAMDILRKKGLLKAAKKASERTAKEGLIACYTHGTGKVGVMVEVNCETDFVARNEAFQELAHDIALHIAATDPLYVRREDVPTEVVEKEKDFHIDELKAQNKPADVIEKILTGKLDKYFSDICLLEQVFVKDDAKKVGEMIAEASAKIGEKIEVSRFTRYMIKK